ncbi:MAG: DUF4340 domain-containing protein [Candidatus Binatia bacterium]
MMNGRRIGVLFLLVAALGAYLWLVERPAAEKEGKKEKLVAAQKDAVTGITLTYPDREIVLARGEKGWRLVKPVDAPADEAAVTSVLNVLVDGEVQKSLDDVPTDLAPFGLDKPVVTAKVALASGEAPPVAVGKNTTIGGKAYVRRGDAPKLLLVASSIPASLTKQVKDLRDKQVVAFQDDDVQKFEIAPAEGDTVTVVRKDKDAWVVNPGDHPADPTEIRSYLSSLRSTRALDFPDDAPADLGKYGLDAPRLTIRAFGGQNGTPLATLLVGSEGKQGTQTQVYAKTAAGPTIYALGDWAVRGLTKTAGQLRDKTVLGFDPALVGKVTLTRKDGGSVTFTRSGKGTWQVEGAADGKSKESMITRFLDDLRDLRGSDVAAEPATDVAPFGLAGPDLAIAVSGKDGQAIGTVLAAKADAKYFAMREGGPTVFEVRDYMYTRLDKRASDFLGTDDAAPPGATGAAMPPSEDGAHEDADDTEDE